MEFYKGKDFNEFKTNWIQNEAKEGEVLTGKVKNIKPFGAFVELENGIIGLLHIEACTVKYRCSELFVSHFSHFCRSKNHIVLDKEAVQLIIDSDIMYFSYRFFLLGVFLLGFCCSERKAR